MPKLSQRKSRADAYFNLYYQLGPERSLSLLFETVTKLGLKTSLQSLKRYSSAFGWQARVVEIDSKVQMEQDADTAHKVAQLNERHAGMGRAMQTLGVFELQRARERLQRQIQEGKESDIMGVKDIVTLVMEGAKLERLAMGQPTERRELTITLWNVFAVQVSHVLKEVVTVVPMKEDQKGALIENFVERFDALGEHYIQEMSRQ